MDSLYWSSVQTIASLTSAVQGNTHRFLGGQLARPARLCRRQTRPFSLRVVAAAAKSCFLRNFLLRKVKCVVVGIKPQHFAPVVVEQQELEG